MSEISDIALQVVQERAAWTADAVKLLRTGAVITAEIDGTPDALTIASELGDDYRNVVLLHVTDDTEAAGIIKLDRVQFTLFGRVTTAEILKRRDNPANPQNEFWAQCLTDKDQT